MYGGGAMRTGYGGDHLDFGGAEFNGPFTAKAEYHDHGPAPIALDALPARAVGFTGREEELNALLDALAPSESERPAPLRVAAVSGLGGIGKTSLAVEGAYEACARGWFPGGVLFVDLHGYDDDPVTADQALRALLRATGVKPEHIPATVDECAALYRSALAQRARERGPVLILADNASSPVQVRLLFPGDSARHRLLVTSRDRLPQLGARMLPLEQLTPTAAYDFMDLALRIADPGDSRVAEDAETASALASRCGHLPLALQIAAALLVADRAKPVTELVAELTELRGRLDHLNDGERSVRATFDLSYRRLPPEQARLLRLLALAPGPDTSTEAVTALSGAETPPVRDLEALARAHLVERVSERQRWRLHDLVRAYGVSVVAGDLALLEEGEAGRERLLWFYVRWAKAADARLRWLPGKPETEGFAVRAEAMAWLDGERAALVGAAQWGTAERHAAAAVRLVENLGLYLQWRRYFDDLLSVGRAGQMAARFTGDRQDEANAWNNLGIALMEVGQVAEAVDALTRARDLYGSLDNRRGEAMAWNSLGRALMETEWTEESIDAQNRACRLYRDAMDPHGEAAALLDLGDALKQAGWTEHAIDVLTRARDLFGAVMDRHFQAFAWEALGSALRAEGRTEEAMSAYGSAVEGYWEFEDWYGAGRALDGLASTYIEAHCPAEARPVYLHAADCYTWADAVAEAAAARARAEALDDSPPPPPTLTP